MESFFCMLQGILATIVDRVAANDFVIAARITLLDIIRTLSDIIRTLSGIIRTQVGMRAWVLVIVSSTLGHFFVGCHKRALPTE